MASVEGLKGYQEFAKQVLTVSSAVMTLTIAFWDKIHPAAAGSVDPRSPPGTLLAAWGLFIAADLAALMILLAVTGSLQAWDRKANRLKLNAAQRKVVGGHVANVNFWAWVILLTFVPGMILLAVSAR